jgi:hypothetical protein
VKPHAGRTDQSKAALQRRTDAERLREAERWRGAMYLLGYAVECALKARLMERYGLWNLTELGTLLSARLGKSVDVFRHSLHELMDLTAAEPRMDRETRQRWGVVRKWQVHWRYNPRAGAPDECASFFDAAHVVLEYVASSV